MGGCRKCCSVKKSGCNKMKRSNSSQCSKMRCKKPKSPRKCPSPKWRKASNKRHASPSECCDPVPICKPQNSPVRNNCGKRLRPQKSTSISVSVSGVMDRTCCKKGKCLANKKRRVKKREDEEKKGYNFSVLSIGPKSLPCKSTNHQSNISLFNVQTDQNRCEGTMIDKLMDVFGYTRKNVEPPKRCRFRKNNRCNEPKKKCKVDRCCSLAPSPKCNAKCCVMPRDCSDCSVTCKVKKKKVSKKCRPGPTPIVCTFGKKMNGTEPCTSLVCRPNPDKALQEQHMNDKYLVIKCKKKKKKKGKCSTCQVACMPKSCSKILACEQNKKKSKKNDMECIEKAVENDRNTVQLVSSFIKKCCVTSIDPDYCCQMKQKGNRSNQKPNDEPGKFVNPYAKYIEIARDCCELLRQKKGAECCQLLCQQKGGADCCQLLCGQQGGACCQLLCQQKGADCCQLLCGAGGCCELRCKKKKCPKEPPILIVTPPQCVPPSKKSKCHPCDDLISNCCKPKPIDCTPCGIGQDIARNFFMQDQVCQQRPHVTFADEGGVGRSGQGCMFTCRPPC